MANPAKRNVTDDSGPDPATSTASDEAAATSNAAPSAKPTKVVPPKAKVKAKSSPAATPARHTMPKPVARGAGPSPRWVPVLMFALWAIGLLLIILNYMGVLPGAEDGGNGWYLVAGLVSILAGIMVATQYR